jgi:hypothetical protein
MLAWLARVAAASAVQPHDADNQARDPNLAIFADLVTVPGTYADTVQRRRFCFLGATVIR